MGKNPAFQFYPNDWLGDPELQQASASSRGIWSNFLCHMWWARSRGILAGTHPELCRLGGCTEQELQIFITENTRLNFADVTERNNLITVANRRMVREEKERESTRYRVQRHRNAKSNANVTVPSPSPSPSPTPKQIHCEASASRNGHQAIDILNWLNTKANKNFRPTVTNLTMIRCRMKEGITEAQLKAIISRKVREWGTDEAMRKYLRPATLFNRTKCEQYIGELPKLEIDNELPGM